MEAQPPLSLFGTAQNFTLTLDGLLSRGKLGPLSIESFS
jgi:hypothetical protein